MYCTTRSNGLRQYANIILTKLRGYRTHWRSGHASVSIDFLFRSYGIACTAAVFKTQTHLRENILHPVFQDFWETLRSKIRDIHSYFFYIYTYFIFLTFMGRKNPQRQHDMCDICKKHFKRFYRLFLGSIESFSFLCFKKICKACGMA